MLSTLIALGLGMGDIMAPVMVLDHLDRKHYFKVTKENIAKCDALVKYV